MFERETTERTIQTTQTLIQRLQTTILRTQQRLDSTYDTLQRADQLLKKTESVEVVTQKEPFHTLEPITNIAENSIRDIGAHLTHVKERVKRTGKKAVIAVSGEPGSGKTRWLAEIASFLGPDVHVGIITSESGMSVGKSIKTHADGEETLVNPQGVSGYFTEEDYRGGSLIVEKGIQLALTDDDVEIILVEAPITTGLQGTTQSIGMDRCTSAVRNIINDPNQNIDSTVIALVAGPNQFRATSVERLFPPKPESEPRGSHRGTMAARSDVDMVITETRTMEIVFPHMDPRFLSPRLLSVQSIRARIVPYLHQLFFGELNPSRVRTGIFLNERPSTAKEHDLTEEKKEEINNTMKKFNYLERPAVRKKIQDLTLE